METMTPQPLTGQELPHSEAAARKESIAGLVLGILSIVLGWLPFVGLLLGIIGLPLSLAAKRRLPTSPYHGIAVGGEVTSIIGLVWGLLTTLLWILAAFGLYYSHYRFPGM